MASNFTEAPNESMTNFSENMRKKLQSAQKNIEWMERTKPSVAARADNDNVQYVNPLGDTVTVSGIALPPHERDCGRSHPMRGTNSQDLTDWCIKHET